MPLAGWSPVGSGYAVDNAVAHEGGRSIRCVCPSAEAVTGAVQVLTYDEPSAEPILLSGWSKAENVAPGGDYSLWLDIIYADDTPLWGQQATFRRGTHGWEYATALVPVARPVKRIEVYLLLRRTTGTVWFDDLFLARGGLHLVPGALTPDPSRGPYGLYVEADLSLSARWTVTVRKADGERVGVKEGEGQSVVWAWDGPDSGGDYQVTLAAETDAGEEASLTLPVTIPEPPRWAGPGDAAVWTETSLRKVYPTDGPPDPPDRTRAAVQLARNEYEAFQVAVRPRPGVTLHRAQLAVSDLIGPEGATLPVTWQPVGFVRVRRPSSHPDAGPPGHWCPDPLLEARPLDVRDGTTQPFWVTVQAPPEAPPGRYTGEVVVEADGRALATVPVEAEVWDFTLPREFHCRTAFALMDGFLRKAYGPITPELRRSCLDFLLAHRLSPDDISRTQPPDVEDVAYAAARGATTFNVVNLVPEPEGDPLWVCYTNLEDYPPDFKERLAARLDGYMAELRRRGLTDRAYFYGFDERGPEYYEFIRDVCGFVKERYPGVKTFTTAGFMPDDRWREDHVDWYCPLVPRYDLEQARMLRAAGEQVWWYVCCGPQYPYPNFASVDYPVLEGRLLFWLTYQWEVDGLLYWHLNYWAYPSNGIVEGGPYLDWELTNIARMSGDGVLTYPGREGLLSSIRLENIRDGLEDYETLWLLAHQEGPAAARAVCDELFRSRTEFTREPAALQATRARLARRLRACLKSRSKGVATIPVPLAKGDHRG